MRVLKKVNVVSQNRRMYPSKKHGKSELIIILPHFIF